MREIILDMRKLKEIESRLKINGLADLDVGYLVKSVHM